MLDAPVLAGGEAYDNAEARVWRGTLKDRPPPEEEKAVKTAIGAARAQQSRKEMLKK
jgi:hypothetical protein